MISSAHALGYRRRFHPCAQGAVLWFLTATYLIIYIKRIAAETPFRNFYRKVTTVNTQTQGKNIKS